MGNVFPDQQVTKRWLGTVATLSCVGCWATAVALKVAEELKSDGFKVKVRGHGHRPIRKGNNNPYDYVSLTEASHAMIYILGEVYDERDVEEEHDPQLEALIAALDP